MLISDWSSDVCSSDLLAIEERLDLGLGEAVLAQHGPAVRAKRRSGVADRTRCFRKAGRYARKTQVPLIGIPLFTEAGRLQMRVMQQIRGACDRRGRNYRLSDKLQQFVYRSLLPPHSPPGAPHPV